MAEVMIETTEAKPLPAEVEIPREAQTPEKERESLIAKAREIGIRERKIANTYRGDCEQQVKEQVRALHRIIARRSEDGARTGSNWLSRVRAALGF
jgi:hypothetical protein